MKAITVLIGCAADYPHMFDVDDVRIPTHTVGGIRPV